MAGYQAPSITEVGSVADFTRGDGNQFEFDGFHYVSITIRGRTIGINVPDVTGPGPGS